MTVGTGIFLGLACLATVFLYTQTIDRWRWRTIVIRATLIACVPIVVVALWLGYLTLQGYLNSRPRPVARYADVSLGDSKDEVMYEKGMPTGVLEEDAALPTGFRLDVKLSDIPSGRHVTDYQYWEYEPTDAARVYVYFSPQTQRVVRVLCSSHGANNCPSLLGVVTGTTEDRVLDMLGKPSHTELSTSFGSEKEMEYSQFRVAFWLEKLQVYGLQLGDIAEPPVQTTKSSHRGVGVEPSDRGQVEPKAPPCKSGAVRCKPWERDWSKSDLPPGTVVTDDGTIVGVHR
jgi:hypothetical protein